jgi:hypothetical protein
VEPDYYTGDGGGWEIQILTMRMKNFPDELEGEVMCFFVLSVSSVSVVEDTPKRKGYHALSDL